MLKESSEKKWKTVHKISTHCEFKLHALRMDRTYTGELSSGSRVFIYMSTRGINLYHVEASAAIQRLLVSFWRYLANENYDLSSEGFYGTSALVSSASCCSLAYVCYGLPDRRANRIGPAAPFTLSGMHVMIILPIFTDIFAAKR